MSLKDLFKENGYKFLSNSSLNSLTSSGIESPEYVKAYLEDRNRFIPLVDYSKPESFARFGSAEKYYYDSITRIYKTYPYDGSKKEKILWELSSSGIDLYIFENDYPRTTGYAIFSTASLTATDTSTNYDYWGSYGAAGTGTYEYISFNGGPHAGTGTRVYIDPDTGEAKYREKANVYDLSKNRECNLKIGGNDGNTVEFWLKKESFGITATQTEVIFDIFTTSSISSSLDYGRLTIEMSGHGVATNTLSPFYVTYMSGTSGISKENIGASITTSSVADDSWHHYSFRFKNDGSNTSVDLFIDGQFNDNIKTGTTVDYVSGTIVGTIGALATNPSGTQAGAPQAEKGWGKLSGSLDEFRFWKVWRTSKQIQTRWFDQVGAGTNTDDANTDLGLYYKFNEGVTNTPAVDLKVLDYSGRVSNGTWTGYSADFSRNTGSAINECGLTNFSASEFRDPILYSFHSSVVSLLDDRRQKGKEYDYRNPSTIYYTMPGWILDEHDTNNTENEGIIANSLLNLTQIMSSYFDDAANLIKTLPSLMNTEYFSGSNKPLPFMNRILESKGFITPEIFNALDALEDLENRDDNFLYTKKIADVKNIIYKNIYNNLNYINKSKGTEKSFRNLIRCFGVDDEIYKINLYSNNVDFLLKDKFRSVSTRHRVINFNEVGNSDATVYQYTINGNSNSTTFISASNNFTLGTSQEFGLPFSVEASIIFPKRVIESDWKTQTKTSEEFANYYPLMETSSLFGMHTAVDSTPAQTTWASNDYANFVVKSIRPDVFSDKTKFVLTGTLGSVIPVLSSSLLSDVYNDSDFNFLVSIYPEKYPNVNEVSGAAGGRSDYTVEFSGVRRVLDVTLEEFTVTGSITAQNAANFLASPKRLFAGAHRTNFTGSVLENTDVKFNNLRAWQNKLSIEDLRVHASDPDNFSIKDPQENAYLFNTQINKVFVPNQETLLLHWNFNSVTASDASGEFSVQDLTSGSTDQISRYGFLANLKNKQFTGKGEYFNASSTSVSVVDQLITAKQNLPETINSEDTIQVLSNDDIYFTRDSRPTFFDMYVEKSPYQSISEEMLKFLSTAIDYNNLIGQGVDRYRNQYKEIELLRNLFFKNIKSEPDLDKYIEYFKWFDVAISAMIQKIAPMTSGLAEKPLRNIIESHIFERNKYETKFPTYEFKQTDPEANLLGINELTYPWKEGHAPLNASAGSQENNCLWFKERAERDGVISSGDADADSDRQEILDVINNKSNAALPNLSGSSGTYQGSTFALRRLAKPYKINAVKETQLHAGGNTYENKKVGIWDALRKRPTPSGAGEGGLISIEPTDSSLDSFKDCDDNIELNKGKRKYKFSVGTAQDGGTFSEVYKGDIVFPFSLYSSSVNSNPAMTNLEVFQSNLAITNLHHDSYGPYGDVPMQGPFTEKFVGGRQYRHVMFNLTPNQAPTVRPLQRIEGWKLTASAGALDLTNVGSDGSGRIRPYSIFFREEYAKRPVNIKNIQQTTGAVGGATDSIDQLNATNIGNYTNTYEIVMTNDRSINNRYMVKSEGNLPTTYTDSTFVSGVVDFTIPRRDLTGSTKAIIVNRFSAPGGPDTMGEGMLDIASAQYSVYNALPFRNLSVRLPLNELHSDHTNQFGLFSDARTVADYERASWATYPGGSSSIDDPGADLAYIGTGSFHKVNRNGRKQPKYSNEYTGELGTISTSASYDNFFVQHQIPQTDVQYAWITASIISGYTGSALYGFEQPDFSNASLASTDLTFATASSAGIAFDGGLSDPYAVYDEKDPDVDPGNLWPFVNFDFVGINYFIVDPLSSSVNTIGYNSSIAVENYGIGAVYVKAEQLGGAINYSQGFGKAGILNAILTHRQGPYGGANWKLYRKDNHPIVRAHRSENRLSYLKVKKAENNNFQQIQLDGYRGSITSVIEPPITSKYKPLVHNLSMSKSPLETPDKVSVANEISHTYMNNIMYFTDHSSDNISLNFDILDPNRNSKTDQEMLDVINYYLLSSQDFAEAPEFRPVMGLNYYKTKETIYPKEQYTYLKTHRQRDNFENGFWRDDAEARRSRTIGTLGTLTYGITPFGYITYTSDIYTYYNRPILAYATSSMWSLDERVSFATGTPGRIKSGIREAEVSLSPLAFNILPAVSASDGGGILQNSFYPYSNNAFITSSGADTTYPTPHLYYSALLPQYNRRIAGVIPSDTTHEYKFGDTKWEAGEQSGKAPFYDTYDDYVEEIKRVGKDYGIIPEFRISEHMDYYLNDAPSGFLSEPDGAYTITGSSLYSSAQSGFAREYLHTDFLKTFSLVNHNAYNDQSEPKKITLSADALIKFLPYDGFYPSERTVQITKLFYDSYSASFSVTGVMAGYGSFGSTEIDLTTTLSGRSTGFMNPVWKSLFAPGILYNSIKSGIAVDYPVHTQDVNLSLVGTPNQRNSLGYLIDIPRINSDFDFRVPFEALVDPETELGSRGIIDNEPHPSASAEITASLIGSGKENYKLAMHNFLASTIDFFRPDSNLTTLTSVPDVDQQFGSIEDSAGVGFVPGKEYRMRLVCYNGRINKRKLLADKYSVFGGDPASLYIKHSASYDVNPSTCVMYAQTGSDDKKLFDYYGSAFGPPSFTQGGQRNATALTEDNVRFNFSSASYEPYTPAYYDGYSHIEFIYRPEFDDDSLSSILSQLTQSCQRSFTSYAGLPGTGMGGTPTADKGPRNAMNLSASFNIALVNKPSVVYDALGNAIEIKDDDSAGAILTIQPKWETPILNFKDVAVTLPLTGSGSVARGMWHQYGRKPRRNEGIFIQIQDLDPSEIDDPTLTGSLAKQLGFKQDPVRLGTVAESKKVSEAIVAIPFIPTVEGGVQIKFPIPRKTVDAAELINEEKTATAEKILQGQNEPTQEILDMVSKMKKFVIPPHLDFVTNKNIDPFAMFIFDFEVTLKEKDLTDMWQNLQPELGRSFQKTEASLPIDIFADGSDKGKSLVSIFPSNTRWMVFKVKQRASYNYFEKTADSSDDKRFKFQFKYGSNNSGKTEVPNYSYNWPFDFCSLIELVKIDAEVESTVDIPQPVILENPVGLNKNLGFDLVNTKTLAELNLAQFAGEGGPTASEEEG